MGKPPAFQYYPAIFEIDTASWTNEEVGAYQRLLNYAWLNNGIPNDSWRLAMIVRTSIEHFEGNLWPIISTKWVKNGHGNFINPRQELERKKQEEYHERQSEAGKRGVEIKKDRGIFPFKQENQATLDKIIKQPLTKQSSDPASQNQALKSLSLSLTTTTRKEERPQSGPLAKLIDTDQEFKTAFYEARAYFPDIGAWFGKSFKQYGEEAVRLNRDELLATMQAIAEKKQFDGDPWGYALKTFLGKVRDKDIAGQGAERARRAVHVRDLYKGFGKARGPSP